MALADWDEYIGKVASPWQKYPAQKNSQTVVAGRWYSSWLLAPFAGATPTTAAVPTMATAGSGDLLTRYNPSADLYLAKAELGASWFTHGAWLLCDRLSHQGGLSGTATGVVTTNLPTAALTRYTSGAGVMAAIEIYTIIGTTGTTITCSYTDQDGTAGNTSQAVAIGNTGLREVGTMIPISLAAGDTGVRSIESSTLAASTLTAGAFGYTLFKPLAMFQQFQQIATEWNAALDGCGNLVAIEDNACLFWMHIGMQTVQSILAGELRFIEA